MQFPEAANPRLAPGTLSSTYTTKPLVEVNGQAVFGEIAIVRCLEQDGWSALWADTFHGRKFWRDMPHLGKPAEPPPHVRDLYNRIAAFKGTPSGCFDVVAWRDDRVIWLEYKGPGDKANKNEALWIEAALLAGVQPTDLVFVGLQSPRTKRTSGPGTKPARKESRISSIATPDQPVRSLVERLLVWLLEVVRRSRT